MKNWSILLSITLVFLISFQSFSQEGAVDKKTLIEVFTSSTCPPCVAGNLTIDGVLAKNHGKYSLIKYQMNWPGTGDPYYMPESGVRRDYYGVTGVPHLRTNGIAPSSAQAWNQNLFNQQLAKKTNMSITAQASVKDGTPGFKTGNDGLVVSCQVELKAHAAYAAGLKAYIMIVEQKTFANATTNGETVFNNVVQGYVISSDGAELEAFEADGVVSFDLEIDLTGSNTETGNDLTLVTYVQDPESMDIIQSEMVEVSHNFEDFSANFTFYDDDYNLIDGGRIEVALAGTEYINGSKASVSKLFPGTYYYEAVVPGYLPYDGEFTINDSDIEQDLFIEIPPFLFYEDFENLGMPDGWTVDYNINDDYFAWTGGRLVFQKQTDGEHAVYLMLPKITVDQGCVLSFKAGESSGHSDVGVGVVSNLQDPENTYVEIVSYEIFNIEGMRTFGGRFDPTLLGNGNLCIKISAPDVLSYYYLDNVVVIENEPGYKVQFQVTDQNGEILPETTVNFREQRLPTNSFGYATWRDCDPNSYHYSVHYKDQEIESGIIEVNGDMEKVVVYNTSGIEDLVNEAIEIYPNPATDQITLKGIDSGRLQIYNVHGSMVKDQILTGTTTISVKNLEAGIYAVMVEGKLIQKILVTN